MKNGYLILALSFLLTACVSKPPENVNDLCGIFKQNPRWESHAMDVQKRWKVPLPVQMAIIHQESKFDAHAQPPRKKLLQIIPWARPSTAYGFSQALRGTWLEYKKSHGNMFSSRDDFGDAVDFIGWYANMAAQRARIPRHDAYNLYLAYHEGIGGYQRKSYLKKPWLISVARRVQAKSQMYEMQHKTCRVR